MPADKRNIHLDSGAYGRSRATGEDSTDPDEQEIRNPTQFADEEASPITSEEEELKHRELIAHSLARSHTQLPNAEYSRTRVVAAAAGGGIVLQRFLTFRQSRSRCCFAFLSSELGFGCFRISRTGVVVVEFVRQFAVLCAVEPAGD